MSRYGNNGGSEGMRDLFDQGIMKIFSRQTWRNHEEFLWKTWRIHEGRYGKKDRSESMERPRRWQPMMNCHTIWYHAGGVPRALPFLVGRSSGRSIGKSVDRSDIVLSVGRSVVWSVRNGFAHAVRHTYGYRPEAPATQSNSMRYILTLVSSPTWRCQKSSSPAC